MRQPLIRLDWSKALDGYEHVRRDGLEPPLLNPNPQTFMIPHGKIAPYYVSGLEERIYLDLANTQPTPEGAAKFTSNWGALFHNEDTLRALGRSEQAMALDVDRVLSFRTEIVNALALIETNDFKKIARNTIFTGIGVFHLQLNIYPYEEPPTLYFRPQHLADFIRAEVLQLTAVRDFARRCAFCGTLFAVGGGTGKNSQAQFCSSKCRLANHRANKKERAAKQTKPRNRPPIGHSNGKRK